MSDIFVHSDNDLGSGPTLEKISSICVCVCVRVSVALMEHGPIMLPVVLYECVTWSLTLRKERILRVFENRVLRKKRSEVT